MILYHCPLIDPSLLKALQVDEMKEEVADGKILTATHCHWLCYDVEPFEAIAVRHANSYCWKKT